MTDQTRKAEQFRAFHIPGKPLVLFNIWDAGSAKAVAARARQTADAADIRFFINARTDVFFQRPAEQHDDMVGDAIERAQPTGA